jgi:arylsulfatase
VFTGNYLGRTYSRATSAKALAQGHVVLRGEFAYDGGGMGKGATLSLFVNDQKVGEARMAATHPLSLGLGGALDIGLDTGAPADESYQAPFPFSATINKVTIKLQPPAQ